MGQQYSTIPPEHLRPQGLYANQPLNADQKHLKRRILEGSLAPCEPGSAENTDGHELEECPICFLFYRALNRARCCGKAVCTECFLQVECLSGEEPCQCPFCKAGGMAVTFSGPRTAAERHSARQEEQLLIEARLQARRNEEAAAEERRAERIAQAAAAAAGGQAEGGEGQAETGSTPPSYAWPPGPASPADQAVSPFSYSSSPCQVSSPRSPASSAGRERAAERQARFMSEKEAQFVPKDLFSNFGSVSMDLDLNDLMLMQALHLSMQEDSQHGKAEPAQSDLADCSEGSGGSASSRVSAAGYSGGAAGVGAQAAQPPGAAAALPGGKAAAGQLPPVLLADATARAPPPPGGRHDVFIGMVLTRFAPPPQYAPEAFPPQGPLAAFGSPARCQSAVAADSQPANDAAGDAANLVPDRQAHSDSSAHPDRAPVSCRKASAACEASAAAAPSPEGCSNTSSDAGAGEGHSSAQQAAAAGTAGPGVQGPREAEPSASPRGALRFEPDEAVLLENPDGSRRFVLLRDDRLEPDQALPGAGAERQEEGTPVDADDAELLATIARGDAAVRAVYERRVRGREEGTLGAAPEIAAAPSSGEQAASSGEPDAEEGWLQRMRAADAALTAALNQGDAKVVQRIGP